MTHDIYVGLCLVLLRQLQVTGADRCGVWQGR